MGKDKEQTKGNDGKRTWKENEKNHGLGLLNVKRTVKRLDGTYEIKWAEGKYMATVTLPNRSE